MENSVKQAYVSGAQDMLEACLKLSIKPMVRSKLLEQFHQLTKNASIKMFQPETVVPRDVAAPEQVLN